jgi:ribosomal protein S18 acetylase RimI-like enzyme
MNAEATIRRELRPGDLGAIVAHHGEIYAREYGVDSSFEAHVCAAVATAARRGLPGDRERVWIVEREGKHAGSIALTEESGELAYVRFFLLDKDLRGRGLGRRLLGELLEQARAAGYTSVGLETFSELTTAARLYRRHGFELVSSETGPRWGRAEITYQRYELALLRSTARFRRGRRSSQAASVWRSQVDAGSSAPSRSR